MSGMSRLRIAAWCAALANVLFLAIAVIRTPAGDWLPAWFVPFVGAAFVAPSIVGLLIANRQPRNVIAWIMLLGPLPLTIQAPLGLVLGEGWALQIDRATWPLLYAWPIAVAYVFPTGRLLSKRWRWMVAYAVTSFVCFTAIALLDPEPVLRRGREDAQSAGGQRCRGMDRERRSLVGLGRVLGRHPGEPHRRLRGDDPPPPPLARDRAPAVDVARLVGRADPARTAVLRPVGVGLR